jgi:twinkle protein
MADADKGMAFLNAQVGKAPAIVAPLELRATVEKLWRDGLPPGDRTGWPSLDKLYTVVPGQLTVLTGWPSSGKSEWLDALLINLMRQGWKTALFSPENQPLELHTAKLLEKISGKPFGHGPTERIAFDEIPEHLDALSQSFGFVTSVSGDAIPAKAVIDAATPWLSKHEGSKRGLVIDPWNELEHWRPSNLSETEYISQTLSMLRSWARANAVHVWIVAHPRNVRRDEGVKLSPPRLDQISGSQHWWNKADCGVTVHRDQTPGASMDVEVHVLKCRFKHVGRIGVVALRYDRVTGRYHEIPALQDVSAYRRAARGEDD